MNVTSGGGGGGESKRGGCARGRSARTGGLPRRLWPRGYDSHRRVCTSEARGAISPLLFSQRVQWAFKSV